MKWRPILILALACSLLAGGCRNGEEPIDTTDAGEDDIGEADVVEVDPEGSVLLTHPGDRISGLSTEVRLVWQLADLDDRYDVDVARDADFTDVLVRERDWEGLDYPLVGLAPDTTYFWRVRVHGDQPRSAWSEVRSFATWQESPQRPVLYQLIVRHFGNTDGDNIVDGTLEQNGVGKFADIDEVALSRLRAMGVTHVYLTGVLQQATLTDYSDIGEPPDDPDILKGRAGSFFAVRDYFDVSPDYAIDPEQRREEFAALVQRIHDAGMMVLIDLVPNHVARSYASTVRPELDLGLHDDQHQQFSPQNNFFYLPGGEPLVLPTAESHWQVEGMDGQFTLADGTAPEDGTEGNFVRVTGNNVISYAPSINDWYETVKLNYGYDFVTGEEAYDPIPPTWEFMAEVFRYWIEDFGVDGFRADFAHFVPDAFWSWVIEETKQRFPHAYFVAEAYENLEGLVHAGFDLVYDDHMYDGLKGIYNGTNDRAGLDGYFASVSDEMRPRYLRYLENHDEKRIASPLIFDTYPGNSGFGDAQAGRHVAPIAYLFGNGGIMLYNGQTVGEEGYGESGFSGNDGRSTIFDYWRVPALSAWNNDGRFDGGGLDDWQLDLHEYYRRLVNLSHHPLFMASGYYGLDYANRGNADYPDGLYAFARYEPGGAKMMVVVTNWDTSEAEGRVRIPAGLANDLAGLGSRVDVRLIFDESGDNSSRLNSERTRGALSEEGFRVVLPHGATRVYLIE